MDAKVQGVFILLAPICLFFINSVEPYLIHNHPCCMEPQENLTLAMIIDAFEIYGHDPTDKLDHYWLYQQEMLEIITASNQYVINEKVHIATDHLARFVHLHVKELKVLLISLDDALDNMLAMYDNHLAIMSERKSVYNGGAVPSEFYMSQEFYCGRNAYIFVSETYNDIYSMGKGPAPYCHDRTFVFLGFVHYQDDTKYYLMDDPTVAFPMDNYLQGLECHLQVCIFRFPYHRILSGSRDVIQLPKAIVKCGLIMYKLPPLSAVSCIITSGTFILDFNIQGVRFRHRDFFLTIPNGEAYYTKEEGTPLVCDHHVCEWNYTNYYGGPFTIPGDPEVIAKPIPPWLDAPSTPPPHTNDSYTFWLEGCVFYYPPNYGSIAGKSYLDSIDLHEDRFTCSSDNGAKGLYWYPRWLGPVPPGNYNEMNNSNNNTQYPMQSGVYYPHQDAHIDNIL